MTKAISVSGLQRLQERVQREIPERFYYARILSVLALHEEIGELLEELSKLQSAAIDSELGDVLLSCMEAANTYGLKLTPGKVPERVDLTEHIDLTEISVRVCIAAARVSKECLEIEGFERPRQPELLETLNHLLQEILSLAVYLDIDLMTAFENKFQKILTLIGNGTWDRLYGDVLVTKRVKFD